MTIIAQRLYSISSTPCLILDLSSSRIPGPAFSVAPGLHVDAILLYRSPVPRLLPRSSPYSWGLVWWRLPFLGRLGFLL